MKVRVVTNCPKCGKRIELKGFIQSNQATCTRCGCTFALAVTIFRGPEVITK